MAPTPTSSSTPKAATTSTASPAQSLKMRDFSKLGEVVTFLIGPQKTKFLVHKHFTCDASPVLKAALSGSFAESQTQTYTLAETTEAVFALFSRFIYTQTLEGDWGCKLSAGKNLSKLWVLAEKLLIPRLQNQVIDRIEAARDELNVIYPHSLKYAWENTASDSPLRRLFIRQCAWLLDGSWFRSHPDVLPHEALIEICSLLREEVKFTDGNARIRKMVSDFYVKED